MSDGLYVKTIYSEEKIKRKKKKSWHRILIKQVEKYHRKNDHKNFL